MELVKSPLGRLRLVGFLEGSSLLILLLIAMPLKYLWDKPEMVRIVGSIHGALFVLFCLFVLSLSIQKGWSFFRITVPLFISSFIPFGTFYMDHKVLKNME